MQDVHIFVMEDADMGRGKQIFMDERGIILLGKEIAKQIHDRVASWLDADAHNPETRRCIVECQYAGDANRSTYYNNEALVPLQLYLILSSQRPQIARWHAVDWIIHHAVCGM